MHSQNKSDFTINHNFRFSGPSNGTNRYIYIFFFKKLWTLNEHL